MDSTTDIEIQKFWVWFANNALLFGEKFENKKLLEELDQQIIALGDFAWEVGPGVGTNSSFVLSPGGDRQLLAVTDAIVSKSPVLDGWEFHSAKPPKKWNLRFQIEDALGASVEIDATGWHCLLLEYPDGAHELVVEAPELGGLAEDYQRWAAEIALDGLLGERRRLESIDYVTVVAKFNEEERGAKFSVREISDRVD